MRLELSGEPEIAAPCDRVWERLLDADFVGKCAPGVRSVESVDDTHFRMLAGFGVGSVKLEFRMEIELSDLVPPQRARLSAHGKAPGSEVHIDGAVDLAAIAPDRTRLTWQMAADVHGTAASVGARLLKATTVKLTDSFWKKFAKRTATQVKPKRASRLKKARGK